MNGNIATVEETRRGDSDPIDGDEFVGGSHETELRNANFYSVFIQQSREIIEASRKLTEIG